jgi:hypothetical protein
VTSKGLNLYLIFKLVTCRTWSNFIHSMNEHRNSTRFQEGHTYLCIFVHMSECFNFRSTRWIPMSSSCELCWNWRRNFTFWFEGKKIPVLHENNFNIIIFLKRKWHMIKSVCVIKFVHLMTIFYNTFCVKYLNEYVAK